VKILTRSLRPEYGVRHNRGRRYYAILQHGDEVLVYHRPKHPPRILSTLINRELKPSDGDGWVLVRKGGQGPFGYAPPYYMRDPGPSKRNRGTFWVGKVGSQDLKNPDEFWLAIIGDLS
jgi:hypothetical protein